MDRTAAGLPYPRLPMLRSFQIPGRVRLLITVVAATGLIILLRVSIPLPDRIDVARMGLWVAMTLIAAEFPVKLEGGVVLHTTTASLIAAVFDSGLPQPFASCWVALIGTIELRDLRRELPWYGTVYNRSVYVLATFAAWLAWAAAEPFATGPLGVLLQVILVGLAFAMVNLFLVVIAVSRRENTAVSRVWQTTVGNVLPGLLGLVPLGWLMSEVADKVGIWAAPVFMVPLLLARYSFTKYTDTRSLFFGTVSALSQAIDAKDGFTRGHADRVSRIAGAIARQMGLSEKLIEQIELAGLLHDIGKIGVEDRVLMKPARLDTDEIELMRRHPIYGAAILEPSAALRPLVQFVLHHHENFDGTGYPEGLKGEGIPLGSRIIIVGDAYEAMTSERIYRKALGHDRAMDELNKYKGIQFDPKVVRALEQLIAKRGPEAFEASTLPPINYETLAELRRRLAHAPLTRDAHAG